MATPKLLVAVALVASTSLAAGIYTGNAWNAADRRAYLAARARLAAQLPPAGDSGTRDDLRRDLYGNPFSPAIGSYRIDAFGAPLEEHFDMPALLKLRSPEG